ncbi:MAG: hypothetical protein HUU29_01705 [Planctomycetaceae bacterium]|nr:hypothetical protein [Planctomycetaceae bacterium]
MTGREQKAFHAITDAEQKDLFIKRGGIDVRFAMEDRLRTGMTLDVARDALDPVIEAWSSDSDAYHLYGSCYNGIARTHIYCYFGDAAEAEEPVLLNWGSFTDQQRDEEKGLNRLEAVLSYRLNLVLRMGMAQSEITTVYKKAQAELERYKTAAASSHRDTPNEDYAGFSAPSLSDYRIEAEWLRAQAHADFYSVLNLERSYVKKEAETEYWYHVIPWRDDSDLYVVVEYRFLNGRLDKWYVYHTDFLGYDRYK